MKILHCIPSLSVGGSERQLALLASAQSLTGNEVHVTFTRDGPGAARLQSAAVVLHRLRAHSNYDTRILWQLMVKLRRVRPDIVQTWLPQMDVVGGIAALTARIPWVVAERSSRAAYNVRFVDRELRPKLVQHADAVVANSRGGEEFWKGTLRDSSKIHMIRNVLPVAEILGTPPATHESLDLHPSTPIGIFAGRLSAEKNIHEVLDVVERVVAASDVVFLICGDGPLRTEAEARVRELINAGRVKFLGNQTEIVGLLKIAHVFLSASLFEGQPNAVMEAMACGCPLVVSDIPAHREFLDSNSAALVPIGDTEQMSLEILAILRGSALSTARAEVSRRKAHEWRTEYAVAQYQKVYERAKRWSGDFGQPG